jgi:hypothetical protein
MCLDCIDCIAGVGMKFVLDTLLMVAIKVCCPAYSPNSLLTRFSTLSFSGSYGWSLEGISSSEGKAAVYVSTRCRIRSAIWGMSGYRLEREDSVEGRVSGNAHAG